MASLSAHLREPGDHGRLAFHPVCPVCRDERLAGTLPADAIVSRRTQALLAAGVLAVSSAAPTAAFAQAEPDQEQEGTATPEETTAGDLASDPDFDPGGESADLPFDAGPPPEAQVAPAPDEDTEALEQEPAIDEVAPVADAGDQASTQVPAEQSTPPAAEDVMPQPTPESPPAAAPTPAPAEPAAESAPVAADTGSNIRALTRGQSRKPEREKSGDAQAQPGGTAPASEPEPVVVVASESSEATMVHVAQEPAVPARATRGNPNAAQPGDRFHVVLAGESLWSISKDVLGDAASVAQVARQVNRLWELNSERIGTGDPDLLMVGTRLVLR